MKTLGIMVRILQIQFTKKLFRYLRQLKQMVLKGSLSLCELQVLDRETHCCFAHMDLGQFHFLSGTKQVVLTDAGNTEAQGRELPFHPYYSFNFAYMIPGLDSQWVNKIMNY